MEIVEDSVMEDSVMEDFMEDMEAGVSEDLDMEAGDSEDADLEDVDLEDLDTEAGDSEDVDLEDLDMDWVLDADWEDLDTKIILTMLDLFLASTNASLFGELTADTLFRDIKIVSGPNWHSAVLISLGIINTHRLTLLDDTNHIK